jgi:hypothetical protein
MPLCKRTPEGTRFCMGELPAWFVAHHIDR